MKKIAILRCFKISSKCSGTGCVSAFNNKTASFNNYEVDSDMTMSIPCSECNTDSLQEVLNLSKELKKQGVEIIHLSTCIRAKCPYYNEFVEELSGDFQVIGYTHGNKKI